MAFKGPQIRGGQEAGRVAADTRHTDSLSIPVSRHRSPAAKDSRSPHSGIGTPSLAVVIVLLVVLASSCGYALQVVFRLGRLEAELRQGNGGNPFVGHEAPSTVKLLEKIADERIAEQLHSAKLHIALEMEKTTKEILTTTVHRKAQEIATTILEAGVRSADEPDDEAGDTGAGDGVNAPPEAAAEASPAKTAVSPEWVKHNMESAFKDTTPGGPRPKVKYDGPLSLEDAVTARAKELDDAWRANGAQEAEKPGLWIAYYDPNMPKLPYRLIRDMQRKQIGVVAVSSYMATKGYYEVTEEEGNFWRMKNTGHILVGMSPSEKCPWRNEKKSENDNDAERQKKAHEGRGEKGWRRVLPNVDAWLRCDGDPKEEEVPPGVPSASMGAPHGYELRLQAFLELTVGVERLKEAKALRKTRPEQRRRRLLHGSLPR